MLLSAGLSVLQTERPSKLQRTLLSYLQEHPGLLDFGERAGVRFRPSSAPDLGDSGSVGFLTRDLARLRVRGWPGALRTDSLRKITVSEPQVIRADSSARQ